MFRSSESSEYAVCDFCMTTYNHAATVCQGCGKAHACYICMERRGEVRDHSSYYPVEWYCHPCVMLERIAEALTPKVAIQQRSGIVETMEAAAAVGFALAIDMPKHEARDTK